MGDLADKVRDFVVFVVSVGATLMCRRPLQNKCPVNERY